MIRKILIFLVSLFVLNAISIATFYSWFTYNSIIPSMAGTGITLSDLFLKKDIPQDKLQVLNSNVKAKAAQLGTQAGKDVATVLTKLFPSPTIDFSKVGSKSYPYPSDTTIAAQNAKLANNAAKDALQLMQNNQTQYEAAAKQGIENAQNAEKNNQVIKDQTLDPKQ
jgi:hypothetical protein